MLARPDEKRRTLRPRHIAVLLAMFAIVCAVLTVDFYRDAKGTAIANLAETQRVHARQASHGVHDFFDQWAGTLTALGAMDGVADADPTGRRTLTLFFEAHKQHLRSLTRVDENGIILAAWPSERSAGQNISSQKHVAEILRNRRPVVSDVFRAVQGFDAVALHVPAFEGTQFRGSIAAVVDFQTLARAYFDDLRVGETSHAFVLSRDGTILYGPDPGLVGRSALQAFRGNDALLQLVHEMMKGGGSVATYRFAPKASPPGNSARKFYAVYEPIPLENTFWSVVVATSEEDLLAGLNSFRDHLYFVIALVFVGGLICAILIVRSWLVVIEERDRRRAEEAARASERLRGLMYDAVSDILFYIAVERESGLRFVSVNAAFLKATGLAEKDVIDRPVEAVLPGSALQKCTEAIASRKTIRWHEAAFHPDGAKEGEVSITPIFDPDGSCSHLFGAIHDVTDKVRAENALRRSEERYRMLFEHSPQAKLVIDDATDRIVAANEAVLQLFYCTREELLSLTVEGIVAPEEREAVAHSRRHDRNPLRRYSDLAFCRHDGSTFLADVVSAAIVYDDRPSRLVAVTDITARRQTEESLRRKEELLRSIIDATPSFVFTFDLEDRFISANRALCEALGFSENDLIGLHLADVGLIEEQRGTLGALRDEVVRTRQPVQFRTNFVLPFQRMVTAEGTLSPLFDDHGNVAAISGITVDVSETLRTAESLDRLSQAVEQASEVIFTTDRAGAITYANPAFHTVYGYSREEVIGKTPRILKSGLTSQAAYEHFWETILAGKSVQGEFVNKRADGTLVTVDRSVSPVVNDAGEVVGFLSVQTDITERKRLQEEREALRSQMAELGKMEAIGTLAGGIAHDFNNILAVILSFATVAERGRNDDERFAKALSSIRQAVGRGADLAKQVLTFARRVESSGAAVDLNELLVETLKMVEITFPRTIVFETLLAQRLPPVIADETQLHQAFLNILINARDAMPNGGTIEVSTAVVDGCEIQRHFPDARPVAHVSVRLRDSGTGMPDDVREHIFEPFFTTKELGRGTGLGLAVTYGAVKSAGGFIRVESEKDHGTMFEVVIPIPESWAPSTHDEPSLAQELRGTESVLFVEDEPEIGPLMVSTLQDHGYAARLACDGVEALEILQRADQPIDVVVSDNDLPRMSGRELFAAMRQQQNRVPFILASGFVDPESLDSLRRAGIHAFLQKPYTADELMQSIRTAVRSGERATTVSSD